MQDLYTILNVDRSASKDEINAAFKKLARKYHPDVNKDEGAIEKFKEISYAYDVLSNPEKRAEYDSGRMFGGGGGKDFHNTDSYIRFNFENLNLNDIFSAFGSNFFTFFGEQGREATETQTGIRRGSDIDVELEVTLEEASNKAVKEVSYNAMIQCNSCSGYGSSSGSSGHMTCSSCHGSGQMKYVNQTLFGEIITSNICSACKGKGVIIRNPCVSCNGAGVKKGKKRVNVTLPYGIRDSVRLKVKEKGNNGPANSKPGNLYILIKLLPHDYFAVEENDIISVLEVPYYMAVLGGKAKVRTLYEEIEILLKPVLKNYDRIKLKGYGMPIFNKNEEKKGDMYLNVELYVPETLTPEEKSAMEQLQKFSSLKAKQKKLHKKHSYFSRIRSFFTNG
jgi:molecular chaperone DnaJ